MSKENLKHEGVEVEDAGILKELANSKGDANDFKNIRVKKTKIIPQKEIEVEISVYDLEARKHEIEADIKQYQELLSSSQKALAEIEEDIKEIEKEAKKLI